MLFNTLKFVPFFVVVFVISWLLMRARLWRMIFLLGASYFFYAGWDWHYLPLIIASSTVDYWLGRLIDDAKEQKNRKRLLWVTVVVNLGFLGFFKYWNFLVDSSQSLLGAMATHGGMFGGKAPALDSWVLNLALPVGISFYTFESMSYVIDVYRKEMPACRSYLQYLLFVAFFPHLVAGPIVRPADLLPQLAKEPSLSKDEASEAFFLIAAGLLKKVVISDYLATNIVDRVFERTASYSSLEVLAGVYGYAFQIYCDFSGYTDIAIGVALLLGVRLNENFRSPYQSANLQEFWRRWHISLSTWLRDYLYIPLGGSQKGRARTYVNLMITMLLGGLWHGASWNFVLWGFLHGGALVVARLFQRFRGVKPGTQPTLVNRWIFGFFTFHYVCFTWIFFRARTFDGAKGILSQLGKLTTYHPNLPWTIGLALGVALLTHLVPHDWYDRARKRFSGLPIPVQGLCLWVVALVLHEAASAKDVPFVYFQF